MTAALNHTIVFCNNAKESAHFLSDIMGLPPPDPFGPFQVIQASNGVSLDFMDSDREIVEQHYAFLVSENEFDEIFDRVKARKLQFWAQPRHRGGGEINRRDGGRGVYFEDPSGHYLEIITRPYGSAE